MTEGWIFVGERTVVTIAFLALCAIVLLNVHALGQYAQLVVGGMMSVLGVIASAWFAGHRAQTAEASIAAVARSSSATVESAAATPGSLLDASRSKGA